jgi:hypothetical protein
LKKVTGLQLWMNYFLISNKRNEKSAYTCSKQQTTLVTFNNRPTKSTIPTSANCMDFSAFFAKVGATTGIINGFISYKLG